MRNDNDDYLTEEQLESLHALLLSTREKLQQELSASKESSKPVDLDLPIGRLTRVDALQQQHMAAAHRHRLETQAEQIRQAIEKHRDGTYGECVRCGEPIGYGRLKAMPEAPFCVRCQKAGR